VIGPNAAQVQFGDYSWSRNNADGVTPLEGIRRVLAKSGADVRYARGCSLMDTDTTAIKEAVDVARKSDVVLMFCGSASTALVRDYSGANCGEGYDLSDLNLTGAQSQLIREVYATGTPVVLVLVTGKPFTIEWEKEHLPAILVQWYSGEKEGDAIADILFGEVNPSGHLPVSFPRSVGHLPAYYNHLPTDKGYYHKHGSLETPGRDYVFSSPTPLWSFGHGLSYTTFGYSNMNIEQTADSVQVSVVVTNTGTRRGKAVAQLYVRDVVSTQVTPVKQLRAFSKVSLDPGESKSVLLPFAIDDLAVTDNTGHRAVEPGVFELQIGDSSDNIVIKRDITIGDYVPILDTDVDTDAYVGTGRKIVISGVVRDLQATPISGAVIVSERQRKTVGKTDSTGAYKVKVADNDKLIFKAIGYIDSSEAVSGRTEIGVTMSK
jgi:beta-glucosidase